MDQAADRQRRRRRSALNLHPDHAWAFLLTAAMAGVDLTQAKLSDDESVVRLAEGLFAALEIDTPLMNTTEH